MSSNEGYADISTEVSLMLRLITFVAAVMISIALWWPFFLKSSNIHAAMSLKQIRFGLPRCSQK